MRLPKWPVWLVLTYFCYTVGAKFIYLKHGRPWLCRVRSLLYTGHRKCRPCRRTKTTQRSPAWQNRCSLAWRSHIDSFDSAVCASRRRIDALPCNPFQFVGRHRLRGFAGRSLRHARLRWLRRLQRVHFGSAMLRE